MKHFLIGCLIVLALAACAPPAQESQGQEPNKVSDTMRIKLGYSQKLLEGIATEDYASIVTNAQKLSLMTLETNWNVLMTPDYLQHSMDFRRSADAIRDAAKAKNLDGATLAYVDMTMKCVNCHKHVRKVRTVQRGGPPLELQRLAKLPAP
jgi:hypothetical protein